MPQGERTDAIPAPCTAAASGLIQSYGESFSLAIGVQGDLFVILSNPKHPAPATAMTLARTFASA
jgi:hypothetical protein